MRVHVFKDDKGDLSAFVEPSPGKGRAPVLLPFITDQNVITEVLPVIEALRQPKSNRPTTPQGG